MPIERVIDHDRRFVRATWSGAVRGSEMFDSVRRLLASPDALEIGRSLTDLRAATLELNATDFSSTQIGAIAPALKGQTWRIALLVNGSLQYAICRQFLSFTATHLVGEVFGDEPTALEWLLREP